MNNEKIEILENEIYYLKRLLEISENHRKKLEKKLEKETKEKHELYFKQPHLQHLQKLKKQWRESMNNATQYRRENVIGEGKRIIFFINNEISAEERARVVRKKGVETLMPDDVFKKFKKWIKQDNRFKK